MSEELNWRIRVFDSLSFPTLILRPDRVVISTNKVFLERMGYRQEDVCGKKCHEIFYGRDVACQEEDCPFQKVIQDKNGHSILRRVYYPERGLVWEDRVFSPILGDDNEVMYVIESIRDVTRTKILERELVGIREFVERVVQSSPSAIVAALRSGRILLMNRAATDLFGFNIRDPRYKNKTVRDLYPEGVAKSIMKKLRDESIGGSGKLPATKINILNTAGEEIPVEITAAIIYDDEEEMATMAIYNDLRDRLAFEKKLKEAQRQLAQSEKMASMGQFAAGVAHEINNPLSGVMLYAGLAKEKLPPEDELQEYLDYIVEDTNRCKDIVKNLLVYSRQTESKKDVIELNDLAEHALHLIRDQKLFSRIAFKKEMSEDSMLVNADVNQISQVIINLVINAVDAMQEEGTLSIKTYCDAAGKKAFFEISDSGSGIPEQFKERLFDPFFTTKEPGKGTGLGLSTAYGFMKENGGNIEIKQTGPEGTTFLLTLPLYTPKNDDAWL